MFRQAASGISSSHLDHHGLIAGVCKDLGIKEKIDSHIEQPDSRRVVSCGTSVVAMILNGLGFSNRRLYLTSQFFESKPVGLLLDDPSLSASDVTSHTLGHALDEIADYGESLLFAKVASEIAVEQNLLGGLNHLDSTSFSLHGKYEGEEGVDSIEVTHGYSKDHRPDLKQVVLSMVVHGPSSIPLWMEALDGNSSDRKSFLETIQKMESFQREIHLDYPHQWVSDSALYSREHLLSNDDVNWLCRVPETIKEAKDWVSRAVSSVDWTVLENGYLSSEKVSEYGGKQHRWLMIYSPQAAERERLTLDKKITKEEQELEKALWHLGNEVFNCSQDAQKAVEKLTRRYKYFEIDSQVNPVNKYSKPGRPKTEEIPDVIGFRVSGKSERNQEEIEAQIHRKGRFILATNNMDTSYKSDAILADYIRVVA